VLNTPNLLTIFRIATIPLFLILLTGGDTGPALAIFVLAGISDALDGAIARLTNAKTELGATLDPLADKLLLLSSFSALAFMGAVPHWLTVLVIMRDVVILFGYLTIFLLIGERMEVRPTLVGKVSTFLQLSSVTFVLLVIQWPGLLPAELLFGLFVVTGAATTVSGLHYMYVGLLHLQRSGAPKAANENPLETGGQPPGIGDSH